MGMFAILDAHKDALVAQYIAASELMEAAQSVEGAAARMIHRCAKGFLVRRRLKHITLCAIVIQKQWRGYLGRLRFQLFRSGRNKTIRQAYFDHAATTIQRWFRGFHSRKYTHSMAARKQYVMEALAQSAAVRDSARAEVAAASTKAAADADERQRSRFMSQASKMHHLVGTRTQPGVFMSPAQMLLGTAPTFDGVPVEDHLRLLCHRTVSLPAVRRERQPLRSGVCLPELLPSELLGDSQRRTLQSLPRYDRPRVAAAVAHEAHKATVRALHGYAFEATGGAKPRLPLRVAEQGSLRCAERWVEPNIARVEGKVPGLDESARRVGRRLFKSTCHRQSTFGRTLRAGEGV
eukprot:jgi/Ulvmu1/8881/UM049_0063.1